MTTETPKTPEQLSSELFTALEARDTGAIGDAMADIFRRYLPPESFKSVPAPEPTPAAAPTTLTPDEQALLDAYRAGKPDAFAKVADKAERRLYRDQPYTANWAHLGTSYTGHHDQGGVDELAWDSRDLRRAWYIVGALVESDFVVFDHEKPDWQHELEHLLIVISQSIKQTRG